MGSPETCGGCGRKARRIGMSGDGPRCLRCAMYGDALPTPPAPADVATDGPNSPGAVYDACRRATAPADDASVERVIQELGAETGIHRLYAHERMALVRAVLNTRADDATRGCTVAFCETHRDVEIVPGPFCPACLGSTCRVDGMRDGLKARSNLPLPGATPDATRVPATDDAVEEAARALIESVPPDFWNNDPPTDDTEVAYAIDYALLDALRAALRRENGGA